MSALIIMPILSLSEGNRYRKVKKNIFSQMQKCHSPLILFIKGRLVQTFRDILLPH